MDIDEITKKYNVIASRLFKGFYGVTKDGDVTDTLEWKLIRDALVSAYQAGILEAMECKHIAEIGCCAECEML